MFASHVGPIFRSTLVARFVGRISYLTGQYGLALLLIVMAIISRAGGDGDGCRKSRLVRRHQRPQIESIFFLKLQRNLTLFVIRRSAT